MCVISIVFLLLQGKGGKRPGTAPAKGKKGADSGAEKMEHILGVSTRVAHSII